jgi:hypothetical protein
MHRHITHAREINDDVSHQMATLSSFKNGDCLTEMKLWLSFHQLHARAISTFLQFLSIFYISNLRAIDPCCCMCFYASYGNENIAILGWSAV